MASKRYIPRNLRWFNRLLKMSYGLWLRLFFRVIGIDAALAHNLRPPFVLVANHVSILDPFILGTFLREPVYWITADGNMRSSIMRALLRLVGSIPKSKAIPDMETVNWIVEVIRKRKGVVGIFPEGQASWDGRTLPLIPSTAKLLKLLKVPVLAALVRGGYSSLPRWSWISRRGRMEIEFRLVFSPDELKALSVPEIASRLDAALAHDESAWNRKAQLRFEALHRAEHLEIPLFMCPRCESIGSMRSWRERFSCIACGEALVFDAFGRFRSTGKEAPAFESIPDWSRWQKEAFESLIIAEAAANPEKPLFSDAGALLLHGRKMQALRRMRSGTLILYPDRIVLATVFGQRLAFPLAEIEGAGVLKHDLFEFYVGRELYQIRFPLRSVSTLKWLMGIEILSREFVAIRD